MDLTTRHKKKRRPELGFLRVFEAFCRELPLYQPIAYKRKGLAVWRPGRYVDGSLTAKEPGKDLRLVAGKRHDPEGDILIRGMALHGLVIREEDQPLSIRRRVRKPVYKLVVESHLLRVAPIRLRSPHFHAAASFRIEVDVLAVRE